jgi:phosphatidylglycerophosphate synthase
MKIGAWLKKLNIADWISLYRIIAVPVLILFIVLNERMLFAWFLLISLSTDMIDGIVARMLGIHSQRGTRIDSYGDFLTFIMAIAGLFRFEFGFIKEHWLLFTIPVALYFLQVGLAVIRFGSPTSFHTYLSKFTFLLQGVFILCLFFFDYFPWLFYASVIMGVLGSVEEIVILYLLDKSKMNVKGIYWILKKRKNK